MLQFYFLSIFTNLCAGLSFLSDWCVGKTSGIATLILALSTRRVKMAIGCAVLLVGFATLFFPIDSRLVLGDLFPSLVGMVMGVALLFEVFKQDAVLPTERVERPEPSGHEKAPAGYRIAFGVLGLAAAVLHFFLPERPVL
jgi:hypothetical protein